MTAEALCIRSLSTTTNSKPFIAPDTPLSAMNPWDHVLSFAPYAGISPHGLDRRRLLQIVSLVQAAHMHDDNAFTKCQRSVYRWMVQIENAAPVNEVVPIEFVSRSSELADNSESLEEIQEICGLSEPVDSSETLEDDIDISSLSIPADISEASKETPYVNEFSIPADSSEALGDEIEIGGSSEVVDSSEAIEEILKLCSSSTPSVNNEALEDALGTNDDYEYMLDNAPVHYYFDDLPAHTQLQRELLMMHINVLRIKEEAARGRHWNIGSRKKGGLHRMINWSTGFYPHNFSQALCSLSFYNVCPGVVLNALLECPHYTLLSDSFYDKICHRFLGSDKDLHNTLVAGKRVYDTVLGNKKNARFLESLWIADNLSAAMGIIRSLVIDATRLHEANPDGAIAKSLGVLLTSSSTKLMHMAIAFGDRHLANEVFRLCYRWLRTSLIAYSVLLHKEAREFNMPAVVAILKVMHARGVAPDPVVWTDILSGMCYRGRFDLAKKLFSMHMMFLPLDPQDEPQDGANQDQITLYAPSSHVARPSGPPNIWEEWFRSTKMRTDVDRVIWSQMTELAQIYHEDPQSIVPWLPTMGTHKIFLKLLCKANLTTDVINYYNVLKRSWTQYSQWVRYPHKRYKLECKFASIQRIVHGHLAQSTPEIRRLYGLDQVTGALDPNGIAIGGQYYHHCDTILELAKLRPAAIKGLPSPLPSRGRLAPDRIMFSKTIREYSKQGDMCTIIHHMRQYPWHNDVAVWTSLIQCICAQVAECPNDIRMAYPPPQSPLPSTPDPATHPDWLDFVFEISAVLWSRGIALTHVTYGSLVQACVQMNDFGKVSRIIDHMEKHSFVRFTADMLRMVVKESGFSIVEMWEMIKGTFGVDAIKNAIRNKSSPSPPRSSVVQPDRIFLSLVIRMAETPEEFALLREIVDDFGECFGIRPLPGDCQWAIMRCRNLHLDRDYTYWAHKIRTENHEATSHYRLGKNE